MARLYLLIVFLFTCMLPGRVLACDLCAIYATLDNRDPAKGVFHAGVAQQFTYYGTVRDNGKKVFADGSQNLKSFVTQVFAAYDIHNDFSLQLTLPVIERRYRRPQGDEFEYGTEGGLGDIPVLVKWYPLQYRAAKLTATLQFFSGLKIPSGQADRLSEELSEDHLHEQDESEVGRDSHGDFAVHASRHGDTAGDERIANAIHGHDLTLGSGSIDFPFGVSSQVGYNRAIASAEIQYMLRTRGQYDYEFGDDLQWNIGLGGYVYLEHESSMALKVVLSGEYKKKDNLDGATLDDTAIRSVFLGPQLSVSLSSGLIADIGADIPLDVNTSDTQITPDYRLRGAVSYRF